MLQIHDSAHGVLFATGELVYVQGMGNINKLRRRSHDYHVLRIIKGKKASND